MKRSVRVVVVDDHFLMAQGTRQLFEQMDGFEVVGVAVNGEQCLELVERLRPDLVFLDYNLPDRSGSEIARQIRAVSPGCYIVIFTGVDISDLTESLLSQQVNGILSKGSGPNSIKNAITCILDNHIVITRSVTPHRKTEDDDLPLSELEINIMQMIVDGVTHEQIAERIRISKRSVDNYLRRIYTKLEVQTKVKAIEKFVQSRHHRETTAY